MLRDFVYFYHEVTGKSIPPIWPQATIHKTEVYSHSKKWIIYLAISGTIPAKAVDEAAKELQKHMTFLNHLTIIPTIIESSDRIKAIVDTKREELCSSFFNRNGLDKNIIWSVNGERLDLITAYEEAFNYIIENQICNRLAFWFWEQFSLRVLVRIVTTNISNETREKPIVTERKAQVLEMKDHVRVTRQKGRKDKHKLVLDQEIVTKIDDIQEGLKVAVVEGEVWKKEIKSIRGDRYVICYNLTDYSNTLLLKTFVDHLDEDQIKIGDCIRAAGVLRYDEIAHELALFLDTYKIVETRNRCDEAINKRIELHAHTKMSAMDSLCDVDALIKRAADWKHQAIAITDHGCIQAFPEAYQASLKYNIKIIYGVEGYLVEDDKKQTPYHIILLACNRTGLRNLYSIISESYLNYFYRQPRIPRKILEQHREGILIGSACEAGELYQEILAGKDDQYLEKIALFYDYLEIQPIANNGFLIREGKVKDEQELRDLNRRIVKLGKRLNKLVVATGDVHFLDPQDEIFRRIIQSGQGYDDAEVQAPLYFKTTNEMLEECSYLGEEEARQVVLDNPKLINEMVATIQPVPNGFYPPKIDSAEEEITKLTWDGAYKRYGKKMPQEIQSRIERELESITHHGFSVLYLIAHKLVKKSNQDGYLVGSRGSVGSSLVAYLTGITEVNPLPPHYLCPSCYYCELIYDRSISCGADLINKSCPLCGNDMLTDGFDIPFETFLGFEGDKVPDIDLNFSGDYQGKAHQYVEELFGSENVFRAGTISTIAERTAYGFVKKYAEEKQLYIKNSEIERLAKGITGVRRTTGQHPGGLIVVPRDHNILEFTPLQNPADNKESGVITTHFEYHAIGDQLVKLDILGHDDPTVIKELEDLTGVNASAIPLNDKRTMALFSGVEPLGVTADEIGSQVGTYGIPEFGTRFVRQMLETTRPTTFGELVRISGLSHGTDVWLNNAQSLIEENIANLNEVICTRDDIMTYLIRQGMEKNQAFKIMENVRKGKGLNGDQIKAMKYCQIPTWYIESCQKIKYMFPRAHAVAYVMMAFRIAYFKVYYPLAFYASFFSIRAEEFDAPTVLEGIGRIKLRISEINRMGFKASPKEKKLLIVLELALEMKARGFNFLPVDLYRSHANRFQIFSNGLLLPFSALPNVGANAAQSIVEARLGGKFVSVEEFQQRTRLNKTAMEVLKQSGCFKDLPESSQLSLFG
ncbi:MAG: PolC-type DNA polymerase III [Syntrophomonadaceae bacterium]